MFQEDYIINWYRYLAAICGDYRLYSIDINSTRIEDGCYWGNRFLVRTINFYYVSYEGIGL